MIVQNVDIKNFRGIEYASIEFKPGFNLIKGENFYIRSDFCWIRRIYRRI